MKIGFQCMPAQDWTAFQWMTSLGRKMKTYFLHMKESESIALGAFLPSSTRYFIEWRHIYVAANLFMKCFAIPLHILHPASQLWNLAFNALGEKFREGHLVNKCRQKNMKFKELFCIFCLRRVECFQVLLSEEMVVHVWIYFRKYFRFDLLGPCQLFCQIR